MKITTWNINSIRFRLEALTKITETLSTDIICLQEIEVATELFPTDEIAAMDYPYQVVSRMKA